MPTGVPLTPLQRQKITADIRNGWSLKDTASRQKVAYSVVKAINAGVRHNDGKSMRARSEESADVAPIPFEALSVEARRAWEDFGFFRARYFGRLSTPWQEEAGYRVLELLATPRKEFLVINAPPGTGKSTLFTHDIPAWLTVRNRGIRGLMGSATQLLAEQYVSLLRDTLENPFPMLAESEELSLGLALDAVATLRDDFGRFRAPDTAMWTKKALRVEQHGGRTSAHKESTWAAYGPDSGKIGNRLDIVLCDDWEDEKHSASAEAIEKQRRQWDKVMEKRLEPGGLCVLNGQRLTIEDLYAYCRDKPDGDPERVHELCCSAEQGRKYHHIVYRAHFEDRCVEEHDAEVAKPYPEGCLLDPRRLPFHELATEMAADDSSYLTVFQQEDSNPQDVLVQKLWVSGGTDPVSGEMYPGCWDTDRDALELPPGLKGPVVSAASTDPSPTKMWATTWWVYSPEHDLRWLMNLERRAMQLPEFLSWDGKTYSGLMDDWWAASKELGRPIRWWILEDNAAQKFMLQIPYMQEWAKKRGVTLVKQTTTHKNKGDKDFGPQILANLYRYGKVRLPGKQMSANNARTTSMKLISEVTTFPKGRTNDCVMSEWFFEHKLKHLSPGESKNLPLFPRASWQRRRAS